MLTAISDDCSTVQRALGEKAGQVVNSIALAFSGLTMGEWLYCTALWLCRAV